MYVDNISGPSFPKPVAGRDIAMLVAGHNSSGVHLKYCRAITHVIQDCANLKAKVHRHENNQRRPTKAGGGQERNAGHGNQQ